jgi:hypothetical protein
MIIIVTIYQLHTWYYKYVLETNHLSQVYSVVAILWLQFTVHVILCSILMFDTSTSALPAVYVQRPIRLFYAVS